MKVFFKRILLIAGISSLMNLFVCLETTIASPLCYMVDGLGQTVDLSYMCSQNTIKENLEEHRRQRNENEEERRILNRRVPVSEETTKQPIQNFRIETFNVPNFVDSDARDYFVITRTVGLDDLSNTFSLNTSNNISSQYVLNSRGELELRYYNVQN